MLAISQIEVAVKKFWSRIGDRMPKPEIEEVGASFGESECFDDQTQVLTDNGWRFFYDLDGSEKVAQYDLGTEEISFATPTAYIKKPYNGLMHHYYGKNTDVKVTPNHEIITIHPQSGSIKKSESASGVWGGNYHYPCSGVAINGKKDLTDAEKVLIAIQADGSMFGTCPSGSGRKDFSFSLKKERKINRVKELLDSLEVGYFERVNSRSGMIVISARLDDFSDVLPHQVKDFSWVDVENVSSEWAEAFIKELALWDGSGREGTDSFVYYNTNEGAVDVVQALCAIGGYSSVKGVNRTEAQSLLNLNPDGIARKSAKDCYAVSIVKRNTRVYPLREEIQYDGFVYCVEVPTGAIVTRRNKTVSIQGNCRHHRAYAELLEQLGLNNEFDHVLEIPAIKKRVNYAQRVLSASKADTNQDYMEAILLFSLFIENVSLFSQFLIISQINKETGRLAGMSNVVAATSLEEQLHAKFGAELVNIIREENPEWFTDDLTARVHQMIDESFEAEKAIIEWIFEDGDLGYITTEEVVEYIKNRYNDGLVDAGFDKYFTVDSSLLKRVKWFDVQNTSTSHVDFFAQRSPNYTKFDSSFDEDDLF